MLSIDQIRVSCRSGTIKPSYIKEDSPSMLGAARELIDAYQAHVGRTQGALDEALKEIEGDNTRFQILRGIAKLLSDRSQFITNSPIDPAELRRHVFEASARAHPVARRASLVHTTTRDDVLREVAAHLETTVERVEAGLHADLKDAQVLESFDPLTPEQLLARYNVGLAQGVLLRASELRIDIHLRGPTSAAQYRQLFRYLKFYQLLHTVDPRPGGGYHIRVDGPTSVLKHSGKYGFKMACFLPALLLSDGWRLEATVIWGTRRKRYAFELSSSDGLSSHLRDRGVYLTEEETLFRERFIALDSPWELRRDDVLLPLGGQGLLIPDFRIVHNEDGREAFFEVLGYWRADYLRRRLDLLAAEGPPNLVLAVSDRMRIDKGKLSDLPLQVIFFKRVIRPKLVVDAVEAVATTP